jgi:molybdenum cofactor cytidylyltransferase
VIAAVVPAAGRSERMGRPKLILPVRGTPLIARVVAALREGGAGRVVVVAPPLAEPGSGRLVETAGGQGAEVVVAGRPPLDMRASVELGLAHLAKGPEPSAILLTPGDLPGLNRMAVARVIEAAAQFPGRIILPRHAGKRCHPLLLPWGLASEITRLPAGVGVNALLADHPDEIVSVEVDDPAILKDLDTPADYERWS